MRHHLCRCCRWRRPLHRAGPGSRESWAASTAAYTSTSLQAFSLLPLLELPIPMGRSWAAAVVRSWAAAVVLPIDPIRAGRAAARLRAGARLRATAGLRTTARRHAAARLRAGARRHAAAGQKPRRRKVSEQMISFFSYNLLPRLT